MLERYLARTRGLAERAMMTFENSLRTKFANQLQADPGGEQKQTGKRSKNQKLRWRAGQNKTANTYVIEIAFDPETKPASQAGGARHPSASPFEKSTTRKPRHYRK
jgi:hypothetical protein